MNNNARRCRKLDIFCIHISAAIKRKTKSKKGKKGYGETTGFFSVAWIRLR